MGDAFASPYLDNRLKLYSLVKQLDGAHVPQEYFNFIKSYINRYSITPNEEPKRYSQFTILPKLEYLDNFNMGNPDKDLVVNDLVFVGDETKKQFSDIGAGLGFYSNQRLVYGKDKYLTLDFSLDGSVGIEKKKTRSNYAVKLCHSNSIGVGIWLDICGLNRELKTNLTKINNEEISVNFDKYLSLFDGGEDKISIKFTSQKNNSYSQNIVKLGLLLSCTYCGNFSEVNYEFFDKSTNRFPTIKSRFSYSINPKIFGDKTLVGFSYVEYREAKLLGVGWSRNNTNYFVRTRFKDWEFFVSYFEDKNSIEYFSSNGLRLGINKPINFVN